MLRIDDVFSTSFDQLLEHIFKSSSGIPTDKPSFRPDNIGSYIELYQEKKHLEARQHKLKKMLSERNASIMRLKEQIINHVSEKKALVRQKVAENRVNENRTRFLAKVSHELRTPVNGIAGIAGLLGDSSLDSNQKKLIDLIEKSSQSLSTLIDDLLDYSKIEAGALSLEQIDFNLEEVVRECLDLLAIRAQEKHLVLDYQPTAGLPSLISGDPLRLKQILINLIGNAIKFTNQGEILITAEPAELSDIGQLIRFRIRDTGIGISEHQRKKLFGYYQQADDSVARKYGGTGLGLAISKELTHLMGGEIGVESNESGGSTFLVYGPLSPTYTGRIDIGSENPENLVAMIENQKELNILLVEDDYISQKVSSTVLKKFGQGRVDIAENGLKAIQKLQQSQYDVVLMDMRMPEMDGIEATRLIRRADSGVINPNIPIIAMTANTQEEDRQECLSAGMDGFISKPLNTSELHQTLQQMIRQPQTNDDNGEPKSLDELPVLDEEKFNQVRVDIGDRFEPLVQLFLEHLPEKLGMIQTAIRENDPKTLQAAAHKLRGNCASFYAEKMADLCRKLEQSGTAITPETTSLLSLLEGETTRLRDILKSRIQAD